MIDTSATVERKVSASVPVLTWEQRKLYTKLRPHVGREAALAEVFKGVEPTYRASRVPGRSPDDLMTPRKRVAHILNIVAQAFETTPDLLKGPRRARHIAFPRFAAVMLLEELCPDLSLPAIGHFMGRRDHTTIIHAIRRARHLLTDEKHLDWQTRYYTARSRLTVGP